MSSILEIWEQYKSSQNINILKTYKSDQGNEASAQDAMLLFFTDLSQDLPKKYTDLDVKSLLEIISSEMDNQANQAQNAHLAKLAQHFFAIKTKQEEPSLIGMTQQTIDIIYKLTLQLLVPQTELQTALIQQPQNRLHYELKRLMGIPQEMRESLLNLFKPFLHYEGIGRVLCRLVPEPDTTSILIAQSFNQILDPDKIAPDGSYDISFLFNRLVDLNHEEWKTIFRAAAPLLKELSSFKQKVLVLSILKTLPVEDRENTITHLYTLLFTILPNEDESQICGNKNTSRCMMNYQTRVLEVLAEYSSEEFHIILPIIIPLIEEIPSEIIDSVLSALRDTGNRNRKVLPQILPLVRNITRSYDLPYVLKAFQAIEDDELGVVASRAATVLQDFYLLDEESIHWIIQLAHKDLQVFDLLEPWVTKLRTGRAFDLRMMMKMDRGQLIFVLNTVLPMLDLDDKNLTDSIGRSHLLKVMIKISTLLMQNSQEFEDSFNIAKSLLEHCQDEYQKAEFIECFFKMTKADMQSLSSHKSELGIGLNGYEKTIILIAIARIPENSRSLMLKTIAYWIKDINDTSNRGDMIKAFHWIPLNETDKILERANGLKLENMPAGSRPLFLRTIYSIREEVYQTIWALVKPIIADDRDALTMTINLALRGDQGVSLAHEFAKMHSPILTQQERMEAFIVFHSQCFALQFSIGNDETTRSVIEAQFRSAMNSDQELQSDEIESKVAVAMGISAKR